MCLLIAMPVNSVLLKDEMESAYQTNDDGCGFAYAENGVIVSEKGMWTFEEFWDRVSKHFGKPMIVHLRLASHGGKCDNTCHPFTLNEEWVFAHNGVIQGLTTYEGKSDTMAFGDIIKGILSHAPEVLHSPGQITLIGSAVGKNNKLAFLHKDGSIAIANKDSGHEKDGVWYSNYSYRVVTVVNNFQKSSRFDSSDPTDWRTLRREWVPAMLTRVVEKIPVTTAMQTIDDLEYDEKYEDYSIITDPDSTEIASETEIEKLQSYKDMDEYSIAASQWDALNPEEDDVRELAKWKYQAELFYACDDSKLDVFDCNANTKLVDCCCCNQRIDPPQEVCLRKDWNKYCCEFCSELADVLN